MRAARATLRLLGSHGAALLCAAAASMLIRREPPELPEFEYDAAFFYSPRCKAAAEKVRRGDKRILSEFTPQQAVLVRAEAVRQEYGTDPRLYGRLYAKAARELA